MTDKLQDLLTLYVNTNDRMVRAPYTQSSHNQIRDEIEAAKRDEADIKQQIAAHFANIVDTAAEGHENATAVMQRGTVERNLASYAGSVLRGVAAVMRETY